MVLASIYSEAMADVPVLSLPTWIWLVLAGIMALVVYFDH